MSSRLGRMGRELLLFFSSGVLDDMEHCSGKKMRMGFFSFQEQRWSSFLFLFILRIPFSSTAQEECKKLNGSSSLPSVTSVYEDQFLQNNTLGSTFWLGGYRSFAAPYKKTSSWMWSDSSNMTYTGWAAGQPNNFGWGERCIR